MPNPDTSQLEAVNTMLALIGATAVSSLSNQTSEDVVLAIRTLEEVNREVQGLGWHWNTDLDQTITADADGRHAWQDDWFRFDPLPGVNPNIDVRREGDFLHDRRTGSNVFGSDGSSLKGDIVRYLGWTSIPETARGYIMKRAARIFLTRQVGDETRAGYGIDDERRARLVMVEADTQQADYSIFDTGVAPYVRHRPGGSGLR